MRPVSTSMTVWAFCRWMPAVRVVKICTSSSLQPRGLSAQCSVLRAFVARLFLAVVYFSRGFLKPCAASAACVMRELPRIRRAHRAIVCPRRRGASHPRFALFTSSLTMRLINSKPVLSLLECTWFQYARPPFLPARDSETSGTRSMA